MTYVIAYLKHGELDTDEPFLCGELPTWGPLEEALEYATLEAARSGGPKRPVGDRYLRPGPRRGSSKRPAPKILLAGA